MKFISVEILNYRNLQHVTANLDNKNVVFGLNDSGKTNFLSALRTIFDYRFRNNIHETDFFDLDTSRMIEIKLGLEVKIGDEHSESIISAMKGAINDDGDENIVYFALKSTWDDQNMISDTQVFWGTSKDDSGLIPVPRVGLNRTLIDEIFDVVYLDAISDGEKEFNQYRKNLDASKNEEDQDITQNITKEFRTINELLASTSLVKNAQSSLTEEYNNLRQEAAQIVIKSEQSMHGFTSSLVPYVSFGESQAFPASGDGRRKILTYAVQNALVKQRLAKKAKISLFLIEEPENSLHRGLKKSLSRRLFGNEMYKYFVMTTHSSEIVSEMDKTMLLRLSDDRINSAFYSVPSQFERVRRGYNASIAEAIFYDKVFLVEGPSEKMLIDAISERLNLYPEEQGAYVLNVYGVGFAKFFGLLNDLGVKVIVRTDNDIKPNNSGADTYAFPGIKRLIQLAGNPQEYNEQWMGKRSLRKTCDDLKRLKDFVSDSDDAGKLAKKHLYLAKDDLENDMYRVAKEEITNDLSGTEIDSTDFVDWMQSSKLLNMVEFTKLMSSQTANVLRESMAGFKEFFD